MFRDQIGTTAQPVACAFDLNYTGVVQKAVQQSSCNHPVAKDVTPFSKPRFGVRITAPFSYLALTSWARRLAAELVIGR
jgi:hypothetical protein